MSTPSQCFLVRKDIRWSMGGKWVAVGQEIHHTETQKAPPFSIWEFSFLQKINDRLFKSFGFLENPPKNKAEKIKSNKKTVDQRWQRCVSPGVSFRSGTSSFYNSNRRISSVSYTHLYTLRSGWSLEWPRREPRITHSSSSHWLERRIRRGGWVVCVWWVNVWLPPLLLHLANHRSSRPSPVSTFKQKRKE